MDEENGSALICFEVPDTADDGPIDENLSNSGRIASQVERLDVDSIGSAIHNVVDRMARYIKPRPGGPSECEIEFGVKVTADSGIVISKIGGEVSLRVKVTWKAEAAKAE